LKSAGLVSSVRGVHGGYVLNKKPSEISLLEIIEALEGDLSLVPCVKDSSRCQRVPICATREIWLKMGNAMRDILNSFTLEDLILLHREKIIKNINYQI
jgi:Rrf2 family protein